MTLSPEEAYGEYSEENIQEVPDIQLVQAGIPLEE
jgi:FKBP-type peptidyl-prolyl cis-trans isomerase 2